MERSYEEGLIAILTDFGDIDNYVAVMKAVIMKENRRVKTLDISNNVLPFSIISGSYLLYTSYKYFPSGTVFLAVIDPGVGSDRKALIVKAGDWFFVGPDNGIFWPIIEENFSQAEAYSISIEKSDLRNISSTFHGRDVFAPIAARLAKNGDPGFFGDPLNLESLSKLSLIKMQKDGAYICFEIIHKDVFGNVVLSSKGKILSIMGKDVEVLKKSDNKKYIFKNVPTFSLLEENELAIYENSFGFLELAKNKGNLFADYGFKIGEKVCLKK
ncbi:SAM-dependent chlorinase/fluorinase [Fervidicoccus fontis]|jgi:S-adenosylmethionine hydrolase|uniref:SAM-dependent chlorinase/fluorinase n=2 Tax=Fervidicoccus fontis TaxID=683846 RepID=I0A191_FERFK|nr:SAM-dependent chlorinase/fluorinase [Fervidicoccus fontis]AFH42748.1 hypothetical protein FFONT_0760 [Fervidicoccus fontis Kam940]MBE9391331.1 SAM-dependent chlorinase/fluorinase [Fervidicoccus fontis]PMB75421.1 MAG: hypothetical protein C0188_03245 [Fervidicoccus fontis]PMB76697.1 MAG: hypothetical protein C0177_05465 [Fervidicoccus fontis]HEW63719.1 hypothetical protein [Fervidicoccus fontis]